jgi:transcription initiation factor TFIIB
MQLPRNLINRAQHIYKIADEKEVVRGKNALSVIGACIVLASRDIEAPRGIVEVCKMIGAPKKETGQSIVSIKKAITSYQISAGKSLVGQSSMRGSVEGLLSRYTNHLDLGMAVYNAAVYVSVRALEKTEIEGRNPSSVASGVLYFICVLFENGITSREIAMRAEVTESTIKLYVSPKDCLNDIDI